MNENKMFCYECRKDVNFNVITKVITNTIKGEAYTYFGKTAYCSECDNEIYVSEINDYNLRALYDKYREKNNIISLNEILEIPKKYKIGKRPLSLLLGWGEHTFTRYCDGDIPTKQYSKTLQTIYDDPIYYKQLLELNNQNIKRNAYIKSKEAVDLLLVEKECEDSKIDLAIQYLLNKCEDITPLALQKALYYIQGFYFAFYNSFLFSEDCQAWVHGPVFRDIYFRYKNYKFDPIEGNNKCVDNALSSSEKAIFESVVKYICCYSGKVLEKFTHSEEPWLLTRGELLESNVSYKVINKEYIGKYFYDVKEKYKMINPSDIRVYTQAMFNQI